MTNYISVARKILTAALLIGLARLVGGYVYEYFHPYIDGTKKGKGK